MKPSPSGESRIVHLVCDNTSVIIIIFFSQPFWRSNLCIVFVTSAAERIPHGLMDVNTRHFGGIDTLGRARLHYDHWCFTVGNFNHTSFKRCPSVISTLSHLKAMRENEITRSAARRNASGPEINGRRFKPQLSSFILSSSTCFHICSGVPSFSYPPSGAQFWLEQKRRHLVWLNKWAVIVSVLSLSVGLLVMYTSQEEVLWVSVSLLRNGKKVIEPGLKSAGRRSGGPRAEGHSSEKSLSTDHRSRFILLLSPKEQDWCQTAGWILSAVESRAGCTKTIHGLACLLQSEGL